jgi:hypothetical protein
MSPKKTPSRHDELFAEYVLALREAVGAARMEFDTSTVRPPLAAGGGGSIPIVVDPRVIAVIRRYFFACDRLNREKSSPSELPHVFVVERLSGSHDDLWNLMVDLPYLPIGTDEQDRWL